jgi:hypothetical protein
MSEADELDKKLDLLRKEKKVKTKVLHKKEHELADLRRLVEILDEVEELATDLSIEKVIAVAPRVAALTAEAERLMKKHELSEELVVYERRLKIVFAPFTEIYRIEQQMKLDIDRMVRIEYRKMLRQQQEEAAAKAQAVMCAKCGKKPRRINEYCKRCARDEGIIVKGKI